MKRLSNYLLFIGLIMATVSMAVSVVYHFSTLELTTPEKTNLTVLYFIGAALVISTAGYKLFKEQK